MQMKIAIITENFIGYRVGGTALFGGAELLLYHYAKLLVELGNEVCIVQFGTDTKEVTHEGMNIKIVRCANPRWLQKIGIIRRWHWGGAVLNRHIPPDTDWIHYHYHYLAFPFNYGNRSRKIITGLSHGVDWDVDEFYRSFSIRNVRERMSLGLLKLVTAMTTSRLDRIWANDRFFIHHVVSRNPGKREKLSYIPNFVDVNSFTYRPKSFQVEVEWRLFMPKMPAFDRGTDHAICAIAVLKKMGYRISLQIAGDNDMRPFFENLAREKGVAAEVTFLGHVENRSMPRLYEEANIVLVPSPWREATPIAVLEAMAVGTPVITTDIGGIPEIAIDGFNATIARPDGDCIAQKIIALMQAPNTRAEISQRARNWVELYFSKEKWSRQVTEFFGGGEV